MKEQVKDELRRLIETCDDENLLIEAKEILLSHESNQSRENAVTGNFSFDKVFGLWKEKDVDLNKLREKQWERKTK